MTVSDVKEVVAPALLVARLTAVPAAFLLTFAVPKLKFAPAGALEMSMPLPPGFVMVVVPETVSAPPTPLSVTPVFVPVFDAEMSPTVAASVPVVRLSARPSPLMERALTVSVPKLVPMMSVPAAPELPVLKPRSVLFWPSVMMFAPALSIVGEEPAAGNGSLPAGTVPVSVASRKPWPMSFCVFSSVMPPV